jgi:hypothetical protein
MSQFRYRHIPIIFCAEAHEHSIFTCEHRLVKVLEWVGTGLAIQRVYNPDLNRNLYYLVHIPSGSALTGDTMPTLMAAGMWLRRILPLFDWTLPEAALKPRSDIGVQVYYSWVQAVHEYNRLLHGRHV